VPNYKTAKMLSEKYNKLSEVVKDLKKEYQNNQPFPNIYIDDFFDVDYLN